MKSFLFCSLVVSALLAMPSLAPAGEPQSAYSNVDEIFGLTGKSLPSDVQKYSWPRSDLKVTLDGVSIQTGLAFGSWGAFHKADTTGQTMVMGDLVLLPSEVGSVVDQLQAGGIDILAIHNHLTGEIPEVVYLHYEGHGAPEDLAKALKAALEKTKTPIQTPAAKPAAELTPVEAKSFDAIQTILGQKGNMVGTVLQIGVPRKDKIEDGGMEIPPSMGMSNSMNFQLAGDRIAATGDFVLVADEVNPVIKELQSHGIRVTALHTHMLHDSPHLFFMHFWALDSPEKVAEGLKAALSKVSTK